MNPLKDVFRTIFDKNTTDADENICCSLNNAFICALSEPETEEGIKALALLKSAAESGEQPEAARFYLEGLKLIEDEIVDICARDDDFKTALDNLSECIKNDPSPDEICEKTWSVFFPEAAGIIDNPEKSINELRATRKVNISELNPSPITEPAKEILFTSNALLTVPSSTERIKEMDLSEDLKKDIISASGEPQVYWYDHPIPMDVAPESNEVLYGLRGLSEAFEFEKEKGSASADDKLTCLLSASVTHNGLQKTTNQYLKEEISNCGGLTNIDLYVFTEDDCRALINSVLAPAAKHYLNKDNPEEALEVLGVDGEYGRHYSFLKAISALWKVLVQPELKATFKIDLDQVFPQEELTRETGGSAFDHFKTPLWGASGTTNDGTPIELGMIAGALVNDNDIDKSIYTVDVTFPDSAPRGDEKVFFSRLPQAVSTEAEMGTRYGSNGIDGTESCIHRIHVTGGTNGILVDSLRKHKPFTPSFIGRAEDQAYILSALFTPGNRLAYTHADGLIMRHDKASFAQEAIKSAHVGKVIGDYVRIIYFSEYARVITNNNVSELKAIIDPFTGCFVSRIPLTIVYLRFALQAAIMFRDDPESSEGIKLVQTGAARLTDAINFTSGEKSTLSQSCNKERLGWDLFYEILDKLEDAIKEEDDFAKNILTDASKIITNCKIG